MSAAQAEYDHMVGAQSRGGPRSHPEDRSNLDDHHSNHSSEHDGSTTLQSSSRSNASTIMPSTTSTYLSTTTQFDANTGPKGVIADARSFETAKKRTFRQTLYAFTDGATTPFKRLQAGREKSSSPSPSLSTDDEEDDFMRQWRENRITELASMKQETRTRRLSPSKRRYGSLLSVDASGYLDAIEKVARDTIVVVLIYDDESTTSNKIEDAVAQLARKNPTIRFVKLHFLEAEMDEIAAPGILAYREGECFANLVSLVGTEIPVGKELNIAAVESVLVKHRIVT